MAVGSVAVQPRAYAIVFLCRINVDDLSVASNIPPDHVGKAFAQNSHQRFIGGVGLAAVGVLVDVCNLEMRRQKREEFAEFECMRVAVEHEELGHFGWESMRSIPLSVRFNKLLNPFLLMGWRWYLYNKTLDQYYYTGSSTLNDIQHDLSFLLGQCGWSLEHSLHYVSDEDTEIDQSKVISWKKGLSSP